MARQKASFSSRPSGEGDDAFLYHQGTVGNEARFNHPLNLKSREGLGNIGCSNYLA
jgi:hypothetical protein